MIIFENVYKEYKQKSLLKKASPKTALNDLSFKIETGEIVGYIGANGAGKSTSLKLMLGVIAPSSGKILVDGTSVQNIKRNEYLKSVGIVYGQRTQLWWDLPVIESLKLIKELYEVPDDVYHNNLKMLASMLDISNILEQPVRTLSLGQRVKADLLAVLLYEPKILFLDEAFNGVDTKSIENIVAFLKAINIKSEITIIFTSHNLGVVEKLCDRIIVLENGHKSYDGSVKNFKSNCKYDMEAEIEIEPSDNLDNIEFSKNLNIEYKIVENTIRIQYNSRDYTLLDILKSLSRIKIIDIKNSEIGLENLMYS